MMPDRPVAHTSGSPFRIVMAYALFGALWILFSDRLMTQFVPAGLIQAVSIAKGWLFIAVTALLLHIMIRHRLSSMAQIIADNQAKEALDSSEKRFRESLENINLIAVLLDVNGNVTYCNNFLQNLTGFSHEEMLGADWFNLTIPDSQQQTKDMFLLGVKNGDIAPHFENPISTKDGKLRYISWNNTILRDSAGFIIGTASLGEDITERKQAEENINQSMREMTVLNSLAQQIATDISLDRILDVSLAGISEICHPDQAIFFMRNGDGMELLRSAPDNSPFKHEVTPVHHVGECLCGLAALSRKPIYSINIQNDPRCCKTECKITGIRSIAALPLQVENQVLGAICLASGAEVDFERQSSFLDAYSGEIALALKNALLVKEVMNHAEELENEVTERKQAEKEILVYRDTLKSMVDERTRELEETKVALMNIVEDLSLKTDELAAANERLTEIDRLKSMFIASMSHELRTPLNSVIGFSSILINGWTGPVNDEQKNCISSILRSGKHLLSLINDVIDVSKIESGIIEINSDYFDLAELLAELEQTVAMDVQKSELYFTVQQLHLPMHTDRRRLLQCLLNLVSNAIKFTEQGGVTVAVSYDEESAEVSIAVSDTGIGIKELDQANLFMPFSRIYSPISSKVLGTGLGLYLTKKMVTEILHGSIRVTSEHGVGSTFSFTIPSRVKM